MTAIPDGFGRATIEFMTVGDAEPMAITFGFTDDGADDPNTVAEDVFDAFTTAFNVPDGFTLDSSIDRCRVSMQRGAALVDGEHIEHIAGTSGSGETMPPAVTALLTKATAAGGRKNRGRCYLPNVFLSPDNVDNAGVINPALQADLTTAWQAFIVALAADGKTMVILHNDATAPTGVVTGFCETKVATQRRRQR